MKSKLKKSRLARASTGRTVRTRAEPAGAVIEMVPAILRMKKILVPVDFSDPSRKAIQYAVPLARQFGAKVTLIHVVEPLPYPSDINYLPMGETLPIKATQAKLDELAKSDVEPQLLDKAVVRTGRAFDAITETARKLRIDLIVISTHGHTGFTRALLGSTAERVVRYAPCPVLTVRAKERDFV